MLLISKQAEKQLKVSCFSHSNAKHHLVLDANVDGCFTGLLVQMVNFRANLNVGFKNTDLTSPTQNFNLFIPIFLLLEG